MTNRVISYMIVVCDTHTGLMESVTRWLQHDYQLYGRPFIEPCGSNYHRWAQALIKYEHPVYDNRPTGE
jgi:hypothetical protein